MRKRLGISGMADLVAARLRMLGAGAISIVRRPDGRGDAMAAIVPGTSSVLRMWREPDGSDLARLHYADGQPISTAMDLRDPVAFAAMLHNIDCGLVHAGIAAPVAMIASVAAALHGSPDGLPGVGGHVEFGDWTGNWTPSAEGIRLIERARDLGIDVESVAGEFPASERDFVEPSLERCRRDAADWTLGVPRGASQSNWRVLGDLPSVRAAAIRLGFGGAPLVGWRTPGADLRIPAGVYYWLLEGTDGASELLAEIVDGTVNLLPARDAAADVLQKHAGSVATLVEATGAAPRRSPGPRSP
jgi:hypothetical protein